MSQRLIDAGELWTYIMMLLHNGDIISSKEVEQAIADCPTIMKWTKSADSLPTEEGYYWCWHKIARDSTKEIWTTSVLYWNNNQWLYYPQHVENVTNVTHWMSLPMPPIEDVNTNNIRRIEGEKSWLKVLE